MMRIFVFVPGVLVLSALLLHPGAEACGPSSPAMHCPVAGLGGEFQKDGCPSGYCGRKVTSKSPSLEYKGGKLYFCCAGCIDQFKKSPEKFAANANHQLVVTGQALQMKCPITGQEPALKNGFLFQSKVAGVYGAFSSQEAKNKVDQAKPAEQLQLVFGAAAFGTGFKMIGKAATPAPKTAAPTTSAASAAAVEGSCCCCQQQAVMQKRDRAE